ncbi:MAG: hypothetical protein QMC96_12530 [Methanomicrobiales archaeon]|nr:hypothetical protein [Methanomicrobiales archaeon]
MAANNSKYRPEFCDVVRMAARDRDDPMTYDQITAILAPLCPGGLNIDTVRVWRHRHPEFKAACLDVKQVAVAVVENATYRHAQGYYVPEPKMVADPAETKTRTIAFTDPAGGAHTIKVPAGFRVESITPRWVAGSHQDRRLLLLNWQPDKWKDTQKIEHSGELSWKALVERATDGGDADGS